MAIVQSIAVGKARKSAGNVTFNTIKGRVIMKEKPAFVANPKTPAQMVQRSKMQRVILAWQNLGYLAKSGWTSKSAYGSEYNASISANIGNIDTILPTGVEPSASQFSGLQIARGKYKAVETTTPQISSGTVEMEAINLSSTGFPLKVGDRIVAVVRQAANKVSAVASRALTAADITADVASIPVEDSKIKTGAISYAMYLVSADGRESTTAFMS